MNIGIQFKINLINKNQFQLNYLNKKKETQIVNGSFSNVNSLQKTDAQTLEKLVEFTQNRTDKSPIVYASYSSQKNPVYIQIAKGKSTKNFSDEDLKNIFNEAEKARLSDRSIDPLLRMESGKVRPFFTAQWRGECD